MVNSSPLVLQNAWKETFTDRQKAVIETVTFLPTTGALVVSNIAKSCLNMITLYRLQQLPIVGLKKSIQGLTADFVQAAVSPVCAAALLVETVAMALFGRVLIKKRANKQDFTLANVSFYTEALLLGVGGQIESGRMKPDHNYFFRASTIHKLNSKGSKIRTAYLSRINALIELTLGWIVMLPLACSNMVQALTNMVVLSLYKKGKTAKALQEIRSEMKVQKSIFVYSQALVFFYAYYCAKIAVQGPTETTLKNMRCREESLYDRRAIDLSKKTTKKIKAHDPEHNRMFTRSIHYNVSFSSKKA
jgi:hypothetical protein